MALDAQTQRMMRNVSDRNRQTALDTARRIRDRLDYVIKALTAGGVPTESVSELSTILDMRLAGLMTQAELESIITADGT